MPSLLVIVDHDKIDLNTAALRSVSIAICLTHCNKVVAALMYQVHKIDYGKLGIFASTVFQIEHDRDNHLDARGGYFIPMVQLIHPKRFGDARGWFTEVYSVPAFEKLGITCTFVQDNHSLSVPAFTLRGLHFQTPPRGQDKLVRCVRGRIFDVAVDIRNGSPTYGQWVGAELSAENGHQLFIPIGFAHGFVTLEDNCEVSYKCSDTYAPDSDGGIRWDDPAIGSGGIDWPMPAGAAPELSAKDAVQPLLADFDSPFPYDGRPLAPLA